jgi:hypothetical protein
MDCEVDCGWEIGFRCLGQRIATSSSFLVRRARLCDDIKDATSSRRCRRGQCSCFRPGKRTWAAHSSNSRFTRICTRCVFEDSGAFSASRGSVVVRKRAKCVRTAIEHDSNDNGCAKGKRQGVRKGQKTGRAQRSKTLVLTHNPSAPASWKCRCSSCVNLQAGGLCWLLTWSPLNRYRSHASSFSR